MVAQFHAWVIERRQEVELKMIHSEQWMQETAMLARAAFASAPTPADTPLCVYEFARHALECIERRRQFELLNVYYFMAANYYNETGLEMHQGQAAQVREMWQMFIEERTESEGEEGSEAE